MSTKIITLDAFVEKANFWFSLYGVLAYDDFHDQPAEQRNWKWRNYLRKLFYYTSFINANWVLLHEAAFVVVNFLENGDFLQAARNLSFMGFVSVADIKILITMQRRRQLNELMRKLYKLYPKDARDQPHYDLQRHLEQYSRFSFVFAFSYTFTVWAYNLLPMINYLIYGRLLQQKTVERTLPYSCWVPFEWRDNWLYYLLYTSQAFAAHSCLAAYLACDLLFCAGAVQLIMHFRKLAGDIKQYQPECVSGRQVGIKSDLGKDLRFLSAVACYHHSVLEINQLINDIFGSSILINFISTSFVMCFLAFQFTVGVPLDALIMLIWYMICSLVQIYMICSYGQQLITTSENIGHAVYNHNWLVSNICYKKLLIMIIRRSQKPAMLRATSFLNVSMGTITDILQLSYKFFALIRTMYSR